MEKPDIYFLSPIRWQFFGTLTFKKELMSEKHRMGMWFAFARGVARKYRIHFLRLPWCLRQEEGEMTGRRHIHFLLTNCDKACVNISSCMYMMHLWESLGGGMARIRLFDHDLAGVDYISKTLGGADVYESNKFNDTTSHLTYSHGLQRILEARAIVSNRQLARSSKRQAGITVSSVGR